MTSKKKRVKFPDVNSQASQQKQTKIRNFPQKEKWGGEDRGKAGGEGKGREEISHLPEIFKKEVYLCSGILMGKRKYMDSEFSLPLLFKNLQGNKLTYTLEDVGAGDALENLAEQTTKHLRDSHRRKNNSAKNYYLHKEKH